MVFCGQPQILHILAPANSTFVMFELFCAIASNEHSLWHQKSVITVSDSESTFIPWLWQRSPPLHIVICLMLIWSDINSSLRSAQSPEATAHPDPSQKNIERLMSRIFEYRDTYHSKLLIWPCISPHCLTSKSCYRPIHLLETFFIESYARESNYINLPSSRAMSTENLLGLSNSSLLWYGASIDRF